MSQIASHRIETAYRDTFSASARLYERGEALFPSGVTHDARYLQPFPVYVEEAQGSRKQTVDGPELIDYWMGHGALLLGHSHPAIVEAVGRQIGRGTHPGACHEGELEWGEWVRKLVPAAERLRFTGSGTEATLMALRVARIVTGKSKILKFAGHFHGWHDWLIPSADPPYTPENQTPPGITDGLMQDLVIVPPGDLEATARAIEEHDPACVILEGNGGHWGRVPIDAEFLHGLRQLTDEKGVIFILDEVITGFRVHPGGFQGYCGIKPDLTTLAKVLAGGLPGGCLAGRADLLQALAFENHYGKKMKHPGTYNANPLSAAAGVAALKIVADGQPCRNANQRARELRLGLNQLFAEKGVDWVAYGDFSAIKILPEYDGPPPQDDTFVPYAGDYLKLDRQIDERLSHAFRCALLLEGIDWMGWGGTTSAVHNEEDVERTIAGFAGAIDRLQADGLVSATAD